MNEQNNISSNKGEKLEDGQEAMFEVGKFKVNGYTFTVKPVYLGEESDYFEDVPFRLYPQKKNEEQEFTEKELSRYAISLFKQESSITKFANEKKGLLEKIKLWLVKTFRKDYLYYSDNPKILGLVKWVEKKVYYKGKHIKFHDLERKYQLKKFEIIKLLGYFEDLSGF